MVAWSRRIQFGISSGPTALFVLIRERDLATYATLVIWVYGTEISAPSGRKILSSDSSLISVLTDCNKSHTLGDVQFFPALRVSKSL